MQGRGSKVPGARLRLIQHGLILLGGEVVDVAVGARLQPLQQLGLDRALQLRRRLRLGLPPVLPLLRPDVTTLACQAGTAGMCVCIHTRNSNYCNMSTFHSTSSGLALGTFPSGTRNASPRVLPCAHRVLVCGELEHRTAAEPAQMKQPHSQAHHDMQSCARAVQAR